MIFGIESSFPWSFAVQGIFLKKISDVNPLKLARLEVLAQKAQFGFVEHYY